MLLDKISQSEILVYIARFIVVFVSYLALCKAGSLLVVPPGQASVIWPAAGVALAAVYLYGTRLIFAVFVAATLNSLSYYQDIDLLNFFTALSIAFGVSFQAVIGAWLIKKFDSGTSLLGRFQEVLSFMFFGGVCACVIGASIASAALLYAGVIEYGYLLTHALSWWIGDVFGVVIFAPILVVLFSASTNNQPVSMKRKLIVVLPMLMSLAAFITLFNFEKKELEDHSYHEYELQTHELAVEFNQDIANKISSLIAVGSFFDASDYVSADEFEIFTEPMLSRLKGLFGLSWLPRVEKDERDSFVKEIREQGYPDYKIRSRMKDGSIVESKVRDVYFPLGYTAPYELNKLAHGFDVYGLDGVSGDVRRKILDEARDSGEARATRRFAIVQKQDEYGFIIYFPIYSTHKPQTVDERQRHHAGYINGVFVFPLLVENLLGKVKNLESDVVLREAAGTTQNVLYDSRTPDKKEGLKETYIFSSASHAKFKIEVAGQPWELVFIRNTPLLTKHYIETLWLYVTGGVFFNVLLLVILTIITARTDFIERLVAEKTAELKLANEELEEFAYRTSHDLRSPLISSRKLVQLTERYVDEGKIPKAKEVMSLTSRSLEQLEALVTDILSLAKTKNLDEAPQEVDLYMIVEDALEKIGHMDGYDQVKIIKEIGFQGALFLKKSRIQLIAENLISNAVKYYDEKEDVPFIKIVTKEENGCFVFSVEDNGLGIPKANQSQLFTMFKRFHAKTSFGSGLGLYMIKKSADILSGTITFEDTGKGSRFVLSIPLEETRR